MPPCPLLSSGTSGRARDAGQIGLGPPEVRRSWCGGHRPEWTHVVGRFRVLRGRRWFSPPAWLSPGREVAPWTIAPSFWSADLVTRARSRSSSGMRRSSSGRYRTFPRWRRATRPCSAAARPGPKRSWSRAPHYLSERFAFPFVALNCGSGRQSPGGRPLRTEREAFTHAQNHREGLLPEAEKGTLFLDEAGTLWG